MTPVVATHLKGTVHGTGGGSYRIAIDDGPVVDATLRGRLKLEDRTGDRVVIGDRVRLAEVSGGFAIETVEPREREIVRRTPGRRTAKVVAANLDSLVVVVAARDPEPRPEGIDRLLVIAEANGVEGVLAVNKVDLPEAREVAERLALIYRAAGYPVHLVSARSGEGLDGLKALLCRGSSAMVGPSGSGKSSLLNVLEPGLALRTGELSRVQRGRHTTVSSRLIPLACGGLVADTPGFSDVGIWDIPGERLESCFPEFEPLLPACRFRGCRHLKEPGCAVLEAVAEGVVPRSRYESYRVLREESL